MAQVDAVAIGARIGACRRQNGVSAHELADMAGAGLTRAIIANIESGRRTDIGVAHLYAIAWALGVSPIALIYPIDRPDFRMQLPDGQDRSVRELIAWSRGHHGPLWSDLDAFTPAGRTTQAVLVGLERLEREESRLATQRDRQARRVLMNVSSSAELAEYERDIREAEDAVDAEKNRLRAIGVEIS